MQRFKYDLFFDQCWEHSQPILFKARFTLSTMEEWGEVDGNFNQKRFFESIIGVFEEDPEDEWVIDTLKWWDKY